VVSSHKQEKNGQSHDYEGSGLPDDRFSCVEKQLFMKKTLIWTDLLQKTASEHGLWQVFKQKWQFVDLSRILAIFTVQAKGFNLHKIQNFINFKKHSLNS
jgi:hypothetical protein